LDAGLFEVSEKETVGNESESIVRESEGVHERQFRGDDLGGEVRGT
jgi:hypothetical protein